MKNRIGVACVLLCFLLLSACFKQEQPVRLRYDLTAYPETLDPQYAVSQTAKTIIENSFEGLTAISPSGEVVPACAERWVVSNDGLNYTFTLRDGLFWANGDSLTAQDFAFALQRLFNCDTPAPDASRYGMIKNAEQILSGQLPLSALGVGAKSDTVLEIALSYDDPSLLSLLASASAMPCQQSFFSAQKGRYGLAAKNILCNGPFFVKSWSGDAISIQQNESFRSPALIEGVDFYINRGDPVSLYLSGRSDLVFVPFQRLYEAGELEGELFYDQSWVLLFNVSNDVLSQRDIRASLTAALDLDELTKRLPDYLQPYNGIIAPSAMLWGKAYRELAPNLRPAALPDAARRIFLDTLIALEQEDVGRLTLLVSDFSPGPDLGGAIQRRWQQELSTFINMEQLDYYELLDRVSSQRFDIAIVPISAQGNSPAELLSAFRELPLKESGDTLSVLELINRAGQQSNPIAAAGQLFMAEQKLVDDYVAVPLFVAPSLFAAADGIEGVSYSTVSRTVYFADAKRVR